jgi:hypothetical protein
MKTIIKSNCNNETFTIGSYNVFSIFIRDKDGYVNAAKLVNDINDKESITKEFQNIIRSPDFRALKSALLTEEGLYVLHCHDLNHKPLQFDHSETRNKRYNKAKKETKSPRPEKHLHNQVFPNLKNNWRESFSPKKVKEGPTIFLHAPKQLNLERVDPKQALLLKHKRRGAGETKRLSPGAIPRLPPSSTCSTPNLTAREHGVQMSPSNSTHNSNSTW